MSDSEGWVQAADHLCYECGGAAKWAYGQEQTPLCEICYKDVDEDSTEFLTEEETF